MNLRAIRLSPWQIWLMSLAGAATVLSLGFECLLRPAWEQWQQTADSLEGRQAEYGRLMRHLAVRKQVSAQADRLSGELTQTDSEECALSGFLRDLEVRSRQANLLLTSLHPLPVKKARVLRQYPVRLAVAGTLADVVRFRSGLAQGPGVTGLEGFSIRGIHGSDAVECQLSVWMVRLVDGRAEASSPTRPAAASSLGLWPRTKEAQNGPPSLHDPQREGAGVPFSLGSSGTNARRGVAGMEEKPVRPGPSSPHDAALAADGFPSNPRGRWAAGPVRTGSSSIRRLGDPFCAFPDRDEMHRSQPLVAQRSPDGT